MLSLHLSLICHSDIFTRNHKFTLAETRRQNYLENKNKQQNNNKTTKKIPNNCTQKDPHVFSIVVWAFNLLYNSPLDWVGLITLVMPFIPLIIIFFKDDTYLTLTGYTNHSVILMSNLINKHYLSMITVLELNFTVSQN